MAEQQIKVSLIVATYAPGDAFTRLLESLDAQTLPTDQWEVVFVDDGSPDDTLEMLRRVAAERPHFRVYAIEHSGWPSKPRNLGVREARGEYVMFADHDDSLYPDGLRRAVEYAEETGADVLNPKECKSNDVWWGLEKPVDGNVTNALDEGADRVVRLMAFMPHKLYRRSLLMEHDICFPENGRVLWEDWYVNVAAWRHAQVVSVLADTPVYLWHASESNTSHTFNSSRLEYWDRIRDVLLHIDQRLDEGRYRNDRAVVLARMLKLRPLEQTARLLSNPAASDAVKGQAFSSTLEFIERYCSDDVYQELPKRYQALVSLMRHENRDLIAAFQSAVRGMTTTTHATAMQWADGLLQIETETRWAPGKLGGSGFELSDGRIRWALPDAVAAALPAELVNHGDDLDSMSTRIALRSRGDHVTWEVPHETTAATVTETNGQGPTAVQRGEVRVDIARAQVGAPLDPGVYELRAKADWLGMEGRSAVGYTGPPLPAIVAGRAPAVYSSIKGSVTIDLAGTMRTLATDARPWGMDGDVSAFTVPLTNLAAFEDAEIDARLSAIGSDVDRKKIDAKSFESLAELGDLHARVVASHGDVALVGGAVLVPGGYTIYAWRDGCLHPTRGRLTVGRRGNAVFKTTT